MDIVYEDEDLIVVRKPAGLAVQTADFRRKDLVSELKNYRAGKKEEPYIGLVHRLDQPVEGLMVFAKTQKAAANLSKQVSGRSVIKEYRARVTGKVEPDRGEMQDWVVKDGKTNTSRLVQKGTKGAKEARLTYEVLSFDEQTDTSDVHIFLHTGRHHQIRLQFASRGWPLVGDRKYGKAETETAGYSCPLALCSCRIAFRHPKTGKKMDFRLDP